jgi:hypothetical protein
MYILAQMAGNNMAMGQASSGAMASHGQVGGSHSVMGQHAGSAAMMGHNAAMGRSMSGGMMAHGQVAGGQKSFGHIAGSAAMSGQNSGFSRAGGSMMGAGQFSLVNIVSIGFLKST